ncbi:Rib/alpha-like domain-containing protein, partial [Dolosicoccus paucivorans]
MFSKNNTRMQTMKRGNKVQTFGIRKFSVGVASVAVAAGIFFGADAVLAAETGAETQEQTQTTQPDAAGEEGADETVGADAGAPNDGAANDGAGELDGTTPDGAGSEQDNSGAGDINPDVTNPGLETDPNADKESQQASGDVDSSLQEQIEQEAIYSPGTWLQNYSYNGTVKLQKEGTKYTTGDTPMAGAKVYLQWTDSNGTVSPVYYTTSNADGRFTIDLSKPFVDGTGVERSFRLSNSLVRKTAIRTWVTLPNEERYDVVKGGDGKGNFHVATARTNESWNLTTGKELIENAQVLVQEKKLLNDWLMKPEAEWTTSGTSDGIWANQGDYGKVEGYVWYDLYEPSGSDARWLKHDNSDVNATGTKIAASYVNDEVAILFDNWKKENPNATIDDFRNAQAQIIAEYQATNGVGSHIAETVIGTVDQNGYYYIPFRGLYGISPYKQNSGASVSHTISDEEYGTVVRDEDLSHGNLMAWNGTVGQKHRHINQDYMYIAPLVENTVIYSNNSRYNMFANPDISRDLNDSKMLSSYNGKRQDFTLLVTNPMHKVTIENSTEEVAKPGDVLVSQTGGLFPNREYQLQWFKDGVPVGDPVTMTSNNVGEIGSHPLTVPADLDQSAIYTSGVFLQGANTSSTSEALALDSVVAVPNEQAELFEPNYTDQDGEAGKEVQSGTPTFTNQDGTPAETQPNNPKFELGADAPAGAVIDPATGNITYTPSEAEAGTAIEIPVTVTYEDGSTDNTNFTINVAELDPVIDRTDDQDAATPEGYVRVTVDAGEGTELAAGETPKHYDVKIGSALAEEHYPNVEVVEGYKEPVTWTVPAGTEITEAVDIVSTAEQQDATKYEPVPQDITTKVDIVPPAQNGIENFDDLPTGTTVDWVEGQEPDVSAVTPEGQPTTGTALVTYPDGSSEEVEIPVIVQENPSFADQYEPQADPLEKDFGQTPTEDEIIGQVTVPGYPEDATPPAITVPDVNQIPDG